MSGFPERRRPRILLSAYACEPDRGSEPEVGLQTVLAAAEHHDVWVLTRSNNLASLLPYLQQHESRNHIEVEGLDLAPWAQVLKKRLGKLGFYWYYDAWQRRCAARAANLHAEHDFDLVHSVTLATYWQRVGVLSVGVPSVIGPVGGGVVSPAALISDLGPRGMLLDLWRIITQRLWEMRPSVRSSLRSADIVLAQNPETAARIQSDGEVTIAPNGTSAAVQNAVRLPRNDEVVVVGRMIPYKGGVLAMRAFARISNSTAKLVFIGDGPEVGRLRSLARRLDLDDRVVFAGRRPRPETVDAVGRAAALLHVALHDDSPLTVAEALSMGTPVICLDRGGPPVICALWPTVPSRIVRVGRRGPTIDAIANAIDESLSSDWEAPELPVRPTRTFREQVLDAYQRAIGINSVDSAGTVDDET